MTASSYREVIFICPGQQLEIRMSDPRTKALCEAAKTLNARYFVTHDGWSIVENAPIWGVFDMRTAQKDMPVRGEWSINDPIKTFPDAAKDAAIMYALMTMGKS